MLHLTLVAKVFRRCAVVGAAGLLQALVVSAQSVAQGNPTQCAPGGATALPPSARPPLAQGREGSQSGILSGIEGRGDLVCPPQQVPLVKEMPPDSSGVMKGNPLLRPNAVLPGSSNRAAAAPSHFAFEEVYGAANQRAAPMGNASCEGVADEGQHTCYYYSTAAANRQMDGGGMMFSINRPGYFSTGGSGHTLAEISVHGGTNNGDILEVGWNVSAHQYGDLDPHLFVFHWKNWQGTCYDGCGWVQVSRLYFPGQNLGKLVGKEVFTGFAYHEGNWWAWFDNEWLGYFPTSEWNGTYTKATQVQWFGEVASSNGIPPQTEMGTGAFPTDTTGAHLSNLCGYDAGTKNCINHTDQFAAVHETAAKYYQIKQVGPSEVRYGGPGR